MSVIGHQVVATAIKQPDSPRLLGVQAVCHECDYRGEIRSTRNIGGATADARTHRTETYQGRVVVAAAEALLAQVTR